MKVNVLNNVQCYQLRELEHGCWADIYMSANGNTGTLFIQSDYGSWDYFWGSCGKPFKEFLVGLDRGYLLTKLNSGKELYFDCDLYIKNLRKELDKLYLNSEIEPQEHDDALWEISEYLEDYSTKESICSAFYSDCKVLSKIFPDGFSTSSATDFHPLMYRFYEEAWVPFVQLLKEELKEVKNV